MGKNNDKFIDELKTNFDGLFEDEELKELSEDLDNRIILNDEAGNEVEFEFLDLIEYQGEEFVVLLPCDEADEAGEVVILRLEDTDDEDTESYSSVDDESVLNAVFEIFKEKFKDEFNFVDRYIRIVLGENLEHICNIRFTRFSVKKVSK